MDPNSNQPGTDGQMPGRQPSQPEPRGNWPPTPRPAADWQRGLGGSPVVRPGVPIQRRPTPPVTGGQPPASMPGGMVSNAPVMGMGGPKKRLSPKLLILIVVVAVLVLGILAYLLFGRGDGSANSAASRSSGGADTTSLATLNNATLNPPADLSAYKADTGTQAGYHVYLAKDSNDNKACSLTLATYSAAQLPGADTNAIVAPQVAKLRELGAIVSGPSAGKALLLKDATNKSVTYNMPTLNYEFTKAKKHASVHYSVIIMKGGRRAEVSRQCADVSASVSASSLTAIDATASHITVTKQ